ncbi:MAG TPA: hypothetical protein VF911_05590 [Thermoanaerobaculia bacterium]
MKLSALGVLLLMSCAASQNSQPPAGPWSVQVTTSGGITGRGNGSWAIASDGKVAVTSMSGKSCAFDATAEQRARFGSLLANARPDTWSASYAPENRCCDRIEYTMTIEESGKQRKVEWIDDPLPMPRDLSAIVNAVTGVPSLRTEYGDKCAG